MDEEESKNLLESPLIVGNCDKETDGSVRLNKLEVTEETCNEVKKQLKIAGPLVVVSFLQYSIQMISVMFVGHLGELSLSGASMATSFANATGITVMLGMGSALETFCGQAYGAKQYHMLGINTQRAMLVLMITCIPIVTLWSLTRQIFTFCGQDLEISARAGVYARWLIPSIFPYGLLQCQLRFFQSQSLVNPLIISTGFTSLLHVLVCWIFVFKCGFGDKGAALSNTISYWINVLILSLYIKFSPSCEKTWTGFSKEGAKNLWSFVSLAIPSTLMQCLEGWSYEVMILMSGFLPNPRLETSMMSISLNTSGSIFRIAFGFGSAVSTRVSNELGAGNPRAAHLAVRVVMFLTVAQGVLVASVSYAARHVWGYMYTNEQEVVAYLASVMPVLIVSNFMDGIQAVLCGTARGCGWQKIGAYVNLGAYYIVGLPLAISLTFVFHFGGKGFWMGIIGGSSLQTILLLIVTSRTNWEQQAKIARNRVYDATIPTDMVY